MASEMMPVYLVFDEGPGQDCGFVEVEDADGHSVRVGEWRERADGLWEFGPLYLAEVSAAVAAHPGRGGPASGGGVEMTEFLTGEDLCEAIEMRLSDCAPESDGLFTEDVLDLLATLGYPGAAETYQNFLASLSSAKEVSA